MNRISLRRPSPAMVVAVLALVMATVGTGYAALKLPKNSVGSKQLKKNSVTKAKIKKNSVTKAKIKKNSVNGAKVKDQSLTGKDINLAKLGTVPAANTANTANTANLANSIPPAEPTHVVGAPGQPGFEGGSSNFGELGPGATLTPVGFYKDHEGIVHLEGIAKVGTEGRIFTLPPGYRPAPNTLRIFEPLEEGIVLIGGSGLAPGGTDLSGAVIGTESGVSLEGITYRAGS